MIAWLKTAWAWLSGIFAFLKGGFSGEAARLAVENADLRQKLTVSIAAAGEEAHRLGRVIAEKDRQLEELRAYLRDAAVADPAGVLDRLLAGPGSGGASKPVPRP